MRPKLNKVTWKAIHIAITIFQDDYSNVASAKLLDDSMTLEQFFDEVVKYLDSKGYIPRMPIPIMKNKLKSPYSTSEYYTFLKIEELIRIKVVLDIRLTNHYHKDWKNHTERDRHLYYMKTEALPEIERDLGLDINNSDVEFFDVTEKEGIIFDLIDIDGLKFNSYSEALIEMKQKIDQLP